MKGGEWRMDCDWIYLIRTYYSRTRISDPSLYNLADPGRWIHSKRTIHTHQCPTNIGDLGGKVCRHN